MSMHTQQTETLISELFHSFSGIFDSIKAVQKEKEQIQQENENLRLMINEETEKYEDHRQTLEDVESKAKKSYDLLQRESRSQNQSLSTEDKLKFQLGNKKQVQQVSQHRLRQLDNQLNVQEQLKQSIVVQIDEIGNDIDVLSGQLGKNEEFNQLLQQSITETHSRNEELKNRIVQVLTQIQSNEEQLKSCLQNRFSKEDTFQMSLQQYREMLNKTAEYTQKINETQKVITKISDDLNSKIQRYQILLQNKRKMEGKVSKFQDCQRNLEVQQEQNQRIFEENKMLKEKINLYQEKTGVRHSSSQFGKNLSNSQVKYLSSPQNNSNMKKSKISASASNHKNSQGTNPQHYNANNSEFSTAKNGENNQYSQQRILHNDMIENLQRGIQEKENEIYEYQREINLLNEIKKKLQIQYQQSQREKTELEAQFNAMQETITIIREKYDKFREEASLHPYLSENEPQSQSDHKNLKGHNNYQQAQYHHQRESDKKATPIMQKKSQEFKSFKI